MTIIVLHKCIVLFSVLFATLLAGLAPGLMLRSFRKQRGKYNISQKGRIKLIFSCLNMFSGGVFLGVCFMHLFPEVREHINVFTAKLKNAKDFPATEFLVVVGFFLVVITEILVSQYLLKKNSKERHSVEIHKEYDRLQEESSPVEGSLAPDQKTCKYGTITNSFSDNEQNEQNGIKSVPTIENGNTSSDSFVDNSNDSNNSPQPFSASDGEEMAVRSVLLFLALSLHTIFDGLSLGLQTDISKLYSIFTAVIIHKILIGFTLGVQIFEYTIWTVRKSFCLMIVFACISPIGIAIGIMIGRIEGHEMSRALASAILNGLATGTFLYVTFIEIIGRELAQAVSVVQILFSIAGFGLMTGLVFFE